MKTKTKKEMQNFLKQWVKNVGRKSDLQSWTVNIYNGKGLYKYYATYGHYQSGADKTISAKEFLK